MWGVRGRRRGGRRGMGGFRTAKGLERGGWGKG